MPAPTRVRQRVLGFTLTLTAIAYLDRVCISMAAPEMKADLGPARTATLACKSKPSLCAWRDPPVVTRGAVGSLPNRNTRWPARGTDRPDKLESLTEHL